MAENYKLSERDPLPNVVRIETLTEDELKYYTSIFGDAALTVQNKIRTSFRQDPLTFYGFMQNDQLTVSYNSSWESGKMKSIFDIVTKGNDGGKTDKLTKNISGKITNAISGVATSIYRAVTVLGSKVGLNPAVTGNATKKYMNGFSATVPSVSCGWYLPQQLQQAVLGLLNLHNMIYPQSPNFNAEESQALTEQVGNVIRDIAGGDFSDAGRGFIDIGEVQLDNIRDLSNSLIDVALNSDNPSAIDNVQTQISTASTFASDVFGLDISIEPRPVKLSIGNKATFEPLILNSMTIKMSKESFLKDFNGKLKLIPQFITVDLGFDYWMLPTARKNKTKFMGLNMFSVDKNGTRRTASALDFNDVFGGNK